MSAVPPSDQAPIYWWQSPTLKGVAVAAALPLYQGGLAAVHLFSGHGTPPDVADVTLAVAAGIGLGVVIYRRIKNGKDPANPEPPVRMQVL